MNLVGYTATALSRNDIIDTPTNKNVVDFAIVELKDLQGNLVVMYDDAEGANPETQKTCDTNGQVTFFAEAGDYVLEVNGRPQKITISVNITVVNDVLSQRIWGDRYKGELTADAGVTLTDEFSVLLYNGSYYSYTGSDPFPLIVAAGTVPAAPDYELKNPSEADSGKNSNGGTVQNQLDFKDGLTVTEAINYAGIASLLGSRVWLTDRNAWFEVVLTSTVTPNGYYKLQSVSSPLHSIKIEDKDFYNLEELGATPDYDPDTQTGTDNSPLIDLIRVDKLNINLNPNKKYKITDSIKIYSGMIWKGDDAYSTEFYPDFSTSGIRMLTTQDSIHEGVSLTGFTLVRIGNNAEHGGLLDALDGAKIDLKVLSDGNALGGGIGISPFYPENRPSKNVDVKVRGTNGGNFLLQIGNVSGGKGSLVNTGTQREAFGIEPYALGKVDISSISANTINYPSHGMITGDPVIYSAQGNPVITGLKNGETFFAIVIDSNNIQLASSDELAWLGQNLTLTYTSGTHRFYRAGLCENFLVGDIESDVGDVASAGSATGVIILTATSGGYHRNVRVKGAVSTLNNPTSGTHNLTVYGAKGVTVDSCNLLGAELDTIFVTRGFLQGVSDSTGNIDPSPALELLPDCRIINSKLQGFKRAGINVTRGKCISVNNELKSEITGATGIIQTPEAEASGSIAKYNDADIPNGTSYDLLRGIENLDANNEVTGSVSIPKIANFKRKIARNLTDTSNVVATLSNALEGVGTFSGTLNITVKANDITNTETATYLLHVVKQHSGSSGALSIVSQLGLVAGTGATWPSFTWSIDASNNLIATEVASTNPNRTWYFYVESQGDLKF